MLIQIDRDDIGLWYLGGFAKHGAPLLVSKTDALDYDDTEKVITNLKTYYKQYPDIIVIIKEVSGNPKLEVTANLVFQSKDWIGGINNSYFNNTINTFIEPNRCYIITIKLERL